LTSVTAVISRNGNLLPAVQLTNGGSGNVYTGTYNAPANVSGGSYTFTATVSATDSVGQSAGPVNAAGSTIQPNETVIPTPQISPASGPYSGSVNVTITDTQLTATILYTTDGSDPLTSATVQTYGTGFALTSSATVTAVAVQTGYLNSAETSASYTISALPPPKVRGISAVNEGNGQLLVTLQNYGGSTATNVALILAKCTWGGIAATSISPTGATATLAPSATTQYTLQFPVNASGAFVTLNGTYSGGNFGGLIAVSNPPAPPS
jgi:hypothetical protein